MSLLNQVLRDLDTRHASDLERGHLPNAVRPLPAETSPSAMPRMMIGVGVGLVVVAVVTWFFSGQKPAAGNAIAVAAAPIQSPANPPPEAIPPVTEPVPHTADALKLDAGLSAIHAKVASEPPKEIVATPVEKIRVARAPSPVLAAPTEKPVKPLPLIVEKPGNIVIAPKVVGHDDESYRLAQGMIERGANAEAEALLRQVLAANPAHSASRQALFKLLVANQRLDDAANVLAEGLRLDPSRTTWAMNLARLQVEQGNNSGAWETLQRSLSYASGQGEYQAFCGAVLQRLKNYPGAGERYRAALQINPTDGRSWIGLGMALEADGKMPESREAFSRAQASGKLSPELAAFVENKLR